MRHLRRFWPTYPQGIRRMCISKLLMPRSRAAGGNWHVGGIRLFSSMRGKQADSLRWGSRGTWGFIGAAPRIIAVPLAITGYCSS